MIAADTLANVLAYSAQLAAIVAAAALLSATIRIDAAGVRYAYWRAVGVLCLALPWLQTAHRPTPSAAPASAGVVTAIVTAVTPSAVHSGPHVDWAALAVIVVAAGAVARLAWVMAGLIRLHRLRATDQHRSTRIGTGHGSTRINTDRHGRESSSASGSLCGDGRV